MFFDYGTLAAQPYIQGQNQQPQNQQAQKKELPETVQSLQTGMQNWFSGTPAGQTVNDWQNTAQQYGQNANDWFNTTSMGQSLNDFNGTYEQRLKQLQDDEKTKNAAELTAFYDSAFKQLGL